MPDIHAARRSCAQRFYLNARREEMRAGMRELLSHLDGSRAARVAMLAGMTREARLERLHALGDEAADHFRTVLPDALARFRHVIPGWRFTDGVRA